ncbi:hypothetical protein CXB51_027398 [Gossypium anomalum]|uniref:Uncharacterized protein n=1 Tax=Gossypium anomalum TaxID=47600 RepID=A0A8J6CMP8_9ROSI|nr:hypothetical protein CXB51_027398 [Gossypium anomalum]
MSACFSWPNLQIQTEKLWKKLMKKGGFFVIPLQSNVTGSRYSYAWMSLIQENGWHILLDATTLGAKEMETLRLSLKSIGLSILKGSTTNVGIVSLVPPSKLEAPKGKAPLHEIEEIIDSRTSNTLQCKALDHADSLGLLVNALISLQHPHSETAIHAFKIYGPKVMFDREKGERIGPALVQKLTNRNNISLCIECLQRIWFSVKHKEMKEKDEFLDANFLEKEKWRYKAINQKTIEI